MLEIIRKCLNIRIFSKNADVSMFFEILFLLNALLIYFTLSYQIST